MIALARAVVSHDDVKANRQPPGTWFPVPLGPHPMPGERVLGGVRVSIYVRCPSCRRTMELSSKVHRVASDGRVSPSLVCPYACAWHVFVRLVDYR